MFQFRKYNKSTCRKIHDRLLIQKSRSVYYVQYRMKIWNAQIKCHNCWGEEAVKFFQLSHTVYCFAINLLTVLPQIRFVGVCLTCKKKKLRIICNLRLEICQLFKKKKLIGDNWEEKKERLWRSTKPAWNVCPEHFVFPWTIYNYVLCYRCDDSCYNGNCECFNMYISKHCSCIGTSSWSFTIIESYYCCQNSQLFLLGDSAYEIVWC